MKFSDRFNQFNQPAIPQDVGLKVPSLGHGLTADYIAMHLLCLTPFTILITMIPSEGTL